MRVQRICSAIHPLATSICLCLMLFVVAGCTSDNHEGVVATTISTDPVPDIKFHLEISRSAARLPVLLLFSGASGPRNYISVANTYADLGYDVVLLDGNQYHPQTAGALEDLRRTIATAQQSPHAFPGKVSVIGFSEGGGVVLGLASSQSDLVAQVVAYYPNTHSIIDKEKVVRGLTVPTLVFAGDADTCCAFNVSRPDWTDCCNIVTISKMAALAKEQDRPLDLVVYRGANHAFNFSDGPNFDKVATADALQRSIIALRRASKT